MIHLKKILSDINLKIFVFPVIFLLIDQVTKTIVFISLFDPMNQIVLFSFFNLTPVWNKGVSFGMFSNSGEIGRIIFILIGVSFGILIPIIASGWEKVERFGFYLVSGGALGNSLDRIIHGKVIDFIDFHYKTTHWPAFNFADIFISCGIIIVLFSGYFVSKDNRL